MENIPIYVAVLFMATTVATLFLFCATVQHSNIAAVRKQAGKVGLGLAIWLTVQAVLTLRGVYYAHTNAFPPRLLVLGILPTVVVILLLFATRKGRRVIDGLPLARLTYLNIVRVPVEVTLLLLAYSKAVPLLMTLEGCNFDILAGITAPFVAWYGVMKQQLGRRVLLARNIACLLLLLNIVVSALLSAPSPLQQLAFDQPNIAILYFPYNWLPVFVVPVVLFGHLAAIRQLVAQNKAIPTSTHVS